MSAVAIVGPGRMGVGIATAVLAAGDGHRVTLLDPKERPAGSEHAALERARGEILANLALLGDLGLVDGDPGERIGRLATGRALDELPAGCDFVFEALPEVVAVKREFFRDVGPLLGDATVVATATSTFHLREFWDGCSRPGSVVAAHWLNPAFLIPLVEVAHGEQTEPWAVEKTLAFLRAIGKVPVTLRSSPGFIVPRIQVAAMNEAVRMLEEGVATAAEIDTAIKAGFGFRLGVMGLVEFIDLGGVDILARAGEYLQGALPAGRYAPPPLVAEKMARGETGPRAGRGFYDYAGVDTDELFRRRYRGFAELLRLYQTSPWLRFAGGVDDAQTPGTRAPRPTHQPEVTP
ncbi:MAG: 3-hydroxyacyl-CoA dehydrogenase NAD-binding domain-containing protein [Deferrisomatales bacterium]